MDNRRVGHYTTAVSTCPALRGLRHFPSTSYFFIAWCVHSVHIFLLHKSNTDETALNEQRRLNISIYNAKVRENREILTDLVDVNCFLAKQHLAFRSNDESSTSSNRGNYVERLHTLAAKDE